MSVWFHGFLGSGVFTKASYSNDSNGTYMSKRAISSVDKEKSAAENYFYQINGTGVSSSSLFSRNVKALDACDDEYGGVVVDPDRLPVNPAAFASTLRFSLSRWKMTVIFGQCLNNSYVAEIISWLSNVGRMWSHKNVCWIPYVGQHIDFQLFHLTAGKEGSLA